MPKEININVSLIINSINPFKEEELLKEIPNIVKDIKSKIKNINGLSEEVQNVLEKLGNVIQNKIKSEKEKFNEEKMDIEEEKKEVGKKNKIKGGGGKLKDDKIMNEKENEIYEQNKNIIDKTYTNLEYEIKNINNLEKYRDKYKNEELFEGHKKLVTLNHD